MGLFVVRAAGLAMIAGLVACGGPAERTGVRDVTTATPEATPATSPPPVTSAERDHPAPVRVYGAAWCAPCHELQRQLTARDIPFETVDVDAQPELWRAAIDWTGFPAMPLTRVTSGALVAWVEGVHADRIEAARTAPSPPQTMYWFVHLDGWTSAVLPDDEAHAVEAWSDVGVRSSAVSDAVRVVRVRAREWDPARAASPLTATRLEVSELWGDGATSVTPLALQSRGRPPFEWDDQAGDELEMALLLHERAHLDRGYLQHRLSSARVALAPRSAGVAITLVEMLGLRSRLGGIEVIERDRRWGIRVSPLVPATAMRASFHLRDGSWLDTAELRRGLDAARRTYLEAGYARVEDSVETIDEVPEAAGEAKTRFVVTLVRGPVVRIARVDVTTRGVGAPESEIRKRIGLRAGEIERPSRLEGERAKLLASGVARHVSVSTSAAPGGDVVHFELDSDEDEGEAAVAALR